MSYYVYTSIYGYLLFDFLQEVIFVEDTIINLEVQEIINGLREAEASIPGISYAQIGDASGKENLSLAPPIQTGITVQLLGNWRIYSERTSGVFRVLGGNLLRADGNDPFEPNNYITYLNIQSAASTIVTTGGTGSDGFTSNDRTMLQGVATDTTTIRANQTNQLTLPRFKELAFNRNNTISAGEVVKYRPNNEFDVNVIYDNDKIPLQEYITSAG